MPSEKTPHIMVIEDSKTQAEIICYYLTSNGYDVTWLETAEKALEEIMRKKPDILLSDIIMPGIDGYSLCKLIRLNQDISHIPIILVSQLADPLDIIKGLCCGANSFIIKPVKRDSLISEIHEVLHDSRINYHGSHKDDEKLSFTYNGKEYLVRSSKSDLLRILLSIYQTALQKNSDLEETTEDLNEFTAHLEEIVHERTRALEATNEIIEHLLVQRTELITRIGHDLKTPLTPLYAFLPYLLNKEEDPEKRDILSLLVKDITTLKQLVDRIVKLSHITIDSFTKDILCADCYHVIEEIIDSYEYQVKEKNLQVRNSINPGTIIHISPFHASTIFENLFSNAIFYNQENGSICIEMKEEGNFHILRVQDTGIGLLPDQALRVFDDFYKADESRHDHSSHGLGLAIVRRIMALYGGFVKVSSEGLGCGSTFEVWIPEQDLTVCMDKKSVTQG